MASEAAVISPCAGNRAPPRDAVPREHREEAADSDSPKRIDAAGTTSVEQQNVHDYDRILKDRLESSNFTPRSFVRSIEGRELTVAHMQKEGFLSPLLVADKTDLELKVPAASCFGVAGVRAAVGSRRCVDVFDCRAQKFLSMTMKEWHTFFEGAERHHRYAVVGFEFSNTKLEPQVSSPRIVRQIDWIEKAWPRHLKELQVEPTSHVEEMMYPKVQKHCEMAVAQCFIDFHIELGGSSKWYHLLSGEQVFFLIPPSDDNLRLFEEWMLSGRPDDTFFADRVERCDRFTLTPGQTLFIPAGWIYATYTVEDTIAFHGNFLHSFAIEKQLQTAHLEEVTHVPSKLRFPFFTEMLWYVLDRYIHCLLGYSHMDLPEEEKRRIRLEKGDNVDPNQEVLRLDSGIVIPQNHTHLTQAELQGLKFIVIYLHTLPMSKKNVPIILPDPIAIVKDVRSIVLSHKDDCPDLAVTGKYILRWSENDDTRRYKRTSKGTDADTAPAKRKANDGNGSHAVASTASKATAQRKTSGGNRRRRVRCKVCDACIGGDCRACVYCKDMTKYGGPGRMKQTCEKRRCLHPQLPVCAYCSVCKLDGWYNEPKQVQNKEQDRPEKAPDLFECTVCLDIVHPKCAENTVGLGKVNEDLSLSNSWECAKCVGSGYSTLSSRISQAVKRGSVSGEESTPAGSPEPTKRNKIE